MTIAPKPREFWPNQIAGVSQTLRRPLHLKRRARPFVLEDRRHSRTLRTLPHVPRAHSRRHRSIDDHRLTDEELGVVAREEQRHRGNIFWTSGARPRLEGGKELRRSLLATGDAIVSERRRDQSGADAIDANLVLGQFDGSRAGQADHSS